MPSRATARRSSGSSPDRRGRLAAAAAALALLAAASGCGFGPGEADEGDATIRVTRDYGAELIAESEIADPTESDTVLRALDQTAEITTRFGGGFVQSIEGIEGEVSGGRSSDWFFFVNGIESPIGSADVRMRAGDRVWWDYRDWTAAMRAPAVVGSWPEPFAQESAEDEPEPVRVECAGTHAPCDEVAERLSEEGVDVGTERFPASKQAAEAMRVLVGPWDELRADATAALVDDGPASSGVFARFEPAGRDWELEPLDVDARRAETLGAGSGLVAAMRPAEDPPVWLVTGTDGAGVEAAVELLDEGDLRDHYAVIAGPDTTVPLPAGEAG